jgi:hypothetical protein
MRTRMLWALSGVVVAACGATGLNLPRLSARAMLPTPDPDSVTVAAVHHDHLGNVRSWVATTRAGVYDCSLEPGERTPLCAKRDSTR